MREWYEVSFSQPGEGEWDEPVSVLSYSYITAAEERMMEDAKHCDDWLGQEWDAHVSRNGRDWYLRLSPPKRIVTVCAVEIGEPERQQ